MRLLYERYISEECHLHFIYFCTFNNAVLADYVQRPAARSYSREIIGVLVTCLFLWTLKSALSCPQQRNNSILLRSTVLHSTTSYSTVTFGDVISQKSAWFKYRFRQLAFGNGVNNMVAPSNIDGAGLAQSA